MPRLKKPPRLYQRPDTDEWIIRDGEFSKRTGCRGPEGSPGHLEADRQLTLYKAEKEGLIGQARPPEDVPVVSVLQYYQDHLPDRVQDRERVGYALQPLILGFAGKSCADLESEHEDENEVLERFMTWRQGGGFKHEMDRLGIETSAKEQVSRATARRDLVVLKAAFARAQGKIITRSPSFKLPSVKNKKVTYLTREQIARVIFELWRGPRARLKNGDLGRATTKTRPQARLALAGFYTGSRPGTLGRTTWKETADGPWVDLEEGIWWRRGEEEDESNKRRNPHKIPAPLLAHLRRWKRLYGESTTYVFETTRGSGMPLMDIGGSLESACKRAGVPRITAHGLKHSAITAFIRSGGTREDAVEYFSTSWETINDTYWDKSPEFQESAAAVAAKMGKRTEMHRNPGK